MTRIKPIFIFLLICSAFLVYSFSIYLRPVWSEPMLSNTESLKASEGKLVWQKYNCQSCHQIYGLGGYLGPDLTNCIAQEGKGELFIRAMVQTGTIQMPAFQLKEEEMQQLINFLSSLNKTGISDPRSYSIYANGMIEANEKN